MWMTAADACRVLGVARRTLYAYVSRGYVRSQPRVGHSHERQYSQEDIERLRRRTEERRDPNKATARALQWGLPVLESSITFIDGQRLYYRGHDALALAASASIESVAGLIWLGRLDATFSNRPTAVKTMPRSLPGKGRFISAAQSMVAEAAAHDPWAFDLRPERVANAGWRIARLLTRVASGANADEETIERGLAGAWRVGVRGADVLRQVLILCADHELNVSSFTARCVASAGSHPYAAVIAGLAALEGTRHGGASARVESLLDSMRRTRDLRGAIADRLRRGETVDGFGHPLYRHGDPRAARLLDLLRERYATSVELDFIIRFRNAAERALAEKPNLDFALAATARVLRLPAGSPLALFAIGRSIGWMGHVIEQYATGQMIRPRARYAGPIPVSASPAGTERRAIAGPPGDVR